MVAEITGRDNRVEFDREGKPFLVRARTVYYPYWCYWCLD